MLARAVYVRERNPFEEGSKAVPACSPLLQAVLGENEIGRSCATVLLVIPLVSTVLQQILQHGRARAGVATVAPERGYSSPNTHCWSLNTASS